MSNYISLDIDATVRGKDISFSVDIPDISSSLDELKKLACEEWNNEYNPDGDKVGATSDNIKLSVTDWGETPEKLRNLEDEDFWEMCEYFSNSLHEIEVFEAAIDCGIQFSDIDEAYQGTHKSDADFAQQLVEDCGDIPKDLPHYIYIDWERTAKDIMMDYSESNTHYFRNL